MASQNRTESSLTTNSPLIWPF